MAKQSKGSSRKSTSKVATEAPKTTQATTTGKPKPASTTKSPGSLASKDRSLTTTKATTKSGSGTTIPHEKKATGQIDGKREKGDDRDKGKKGESEKNGEKKQEKRDGEQQKGKEKMEEQDNKQQKREDKKQEKKLEPGNADAKTRKCAGVKSKPRCGWNDTAHCQWKDGQCVYLPGVAEGSTGKPIVNKVTNGKNSAISGHPDQWPIGLVLLMLLAIIRFFRH